MTDGTLPSERQAQLLVALSEAVQEALLAINEIPGRSITEQIWISDLRTSVAEATANYKKSLEESAARATDREPSNPTWWQFWEWPRVDRN